MTSLFTHPACLRHDNGPSHPESPERLRAVLAELEKPDYRALQRQKAPQATLQQIARVHDRSHSENIFFRIPKQGYAALDPDTSLSPGSHEAVLRAAGALVAAVDEVMNGKSKNVFCAVRPPGHHAEPATAMGFCLFNNIAIGSAHALEAHGLKRIAIIDFDVHHGNGTQKWAEGREEILFVSSHQFPFYPGSGGAGECGAIGNSVNMPLAYGTGSAEFREAWRNTGLPAIENFKPELILISAGFDAHRDDPLAGLNLGAEDFGWITMEACKLADKHCRGRIVSTLEGGYDLDALAQSAGAHVRALMAVGNP